MQVATDTGKLDLVAHGISDTLAAIQVEGSPLFKTGTPYYRRAMGAAPAFMVWWDGFSSLEREGSVKPESSVKTHRFQLELYCLMGANEEDNDRRFKAMIKAAMDALEENPRLNNTCLRSRVAQGQADMWSDDGKAVYLQLITFVEADIFGSW